MLWEQWGWEMPQEPPGTGNLLGAGLAAGLGAGRTRGSQFGELKVLCVHSASCHQTPQHRAVLSPRNPQGQPYGEMPQKPFPSPRQEQGAGFLRVLRPGPVSCFAKPCQ